MVIAADALVLFGITGDLARKKLFSALYQLTEEGRLDMPVVGVASRDWDDDTLRHHVREALQGRDEPFDNEVFERLAANLCYVAGNYRDQTTYREIAARVEGKQCVVAYLAIPPNLFDDVITGLAEVGLSDDGRVVVEKPFGRDAGSAAELNRIVHEAYSEDSVYRIDHFLGKEAVQNLMVFRFANTILEPVWNRHYIRGVQVTLAESFDVEGRGSFYDAVGAVRDVVQNHLLQVVALLAMEPPVSDHPDALRDERIKVLRAVRTLAPEDLVLGQYHGYRDEPGVDPGSDTETFAAVRLQIDSWRWAGVPWLLRTGKAMSDTVTEAVVEFATPPRALFVGGEPGPEPNRLTFRTKPDEDITLSMQAKVPGQALVSGPIEFHLQHDRVRGREAYDRLLADALRGDPALFARQDAVAEAWRIVDKVLVERPAILPYERGSNGPAAADRLLNGWTWATLPGGT